MRTRRRRGKREGWRDWGFHFFGREGGEREKKGNNREGGGGVGELGEEGERREGVGGRGVRFLLKLTLGVTDK
jgi:hypothetical protein